MNIATLSGSGRPESGNRRLLAALPALKPGWNWTDLTELAIQLPVFVDGRSQKAEADDFKRAVGDAAAYVISTPEYLHNCPALLKSGLEWLAAGGEMSGKPVLAVTFTPHPPRGERALQSLCWSLEALDARIVAQLSLYREEVIFTQDGQLVECPARELLAEALQLF